jgi:uncharacterized protein YggE
MTRLKLAGIAVATAALVAVVAVGDPPRAYGRAAELIQNGVTVTGRGVVKTVPDRARVSFGVQAQGKGASTAFSTAGEQLAKVISALIATGVERADIQTQQISLDARYTENGSDIVGYVATTSVSVTLRKLDRAGAVIDAAVAAGANQVSEFSLFRSNQDELYRSALKAAVADARAKAEAIAGAAGVTVAKVTAVEESGGDDSGPVMMAAAAPDATPIEPGTQQLEASVVVSFAIS